MARENLTSDPTDTQLSFSVLLFFNAFPGMAVFAALLPAAASYRDSNHYVLSCSMVALALGGVLASSIHAVLGARRTFAAIFGLRGILLTVLSRSSRDHTPSMALSALLAVLFGHGVGFSVLPILIKSEHPGMIPFYTAYARILPAWGAAGIAGATYQSVWLSTTGSMDGGWLYVGILAASASAVTLILPLSFFEAQRHG